jgi:hypothetical protein
MPADPIPVASSPQAPYSTRALDILLLLFILNLTMQPPVEPDFGWHLRAGLDFLDRGGRLPAHDPYSHTMPDWQWVEHAWLTDAVIALVYRGLGSAGALGVIVCFAAIAIAAFMIGAARAQASRTARLAAIVASLWVALPFLGARTQLVSLAGVAFVLWLYHGIAQGRTWFIWLYPPAFFLWANLHGGFTAGLAVLGIILAAAAVVRFADMAWPAIMRLDEPLPPSKVLVSLAVSFALSCAVTSLNPYGWRLHREIYESLSDRFMLEQLREWQPVSFEGWAGTAFLLYLVILAGSAVLWYRRVEPIRWALLAVSLVWSFWHWRNVTIFLVVAVPLVAELFQAGSLAIARLISLRQRAAVMLAVTLMTGLLLVSLDGQHLERLLSAGTEPEKFFRQTEYPIEAVAWVRANRHEVGRRLYNDYGYGGFLLWWMPEEKIFIDGRMPAWRIGDRTIFPHYMAIAAGAPTAQDLLEKYRVDWVLIQRDSQVAAMLRSDPGWRQLYADPKVVIMRRTL